MALNQSSRTNWQKVMAEVERRIYTREWQPGQSIPNEADLAVEFRCARVTVNRALRTLADAGLLDRRRKSGTRVALHPVRKATLQILLIRKEIEASKKSYGYNLLLQELALAPEFVSDRFGLASDVLLLHIVALHTANGKPYVIEDRWINVSAIPEVMSVSFAKLSANEWLVQAIPYTHGDIAFGVLNAGKEQARLLGTEPSKALFEIERTTWDHATALTTVQLVFHAGYRKHASL
jgi:GntR family histidine utilization transcriptional repressor